MFATFSRQNLASSKAFIATSLLNKLEGVLLLFSSPYMAGSLYFINKFEIDANLVMLFFQNN